MVLPLWAMLPLPAVTVPFWGRAKAVLEIDVINNASKILFRKFDFFNPNIDTILL